MVINQVNLFCENSDWRKKQKPIYLLWLWHETEIKSLLKNLLIPIVWESKGLLDLKMKLISARVAVLMLLPWYQLRLLVLMKYWQANLCGWKSPRSATRDDIGYYFTAEDTEHTKKQRVLIFKDEPLTGHLPVQHKCWCWSQRQPCARPPPRPAKVPARTPGFGQQSPPAGSSHTSGWACWGKISLCGLERLRLHQQPAGNSKRALRGSCADGLNPNGINNRLFCWKWKKKKEQGGQREKKQVSLS